MRRITDSIPPEELEGMAETNNMGPSTLGSDPPESLELLDEPEILAGGWAKRIDLDYILSSSQHCFWATVGTQSCYKWMNDDTIETIVHLAFDAPKVSIQNNSGNRQIQRIRPIKTF